MAIYLYLSQGQFRCEMFECARAYIHLLNCCNAAPSPSDSTRVVHARRQVAAELEDMARLRDP